jgi:hypothetical protein
MFRCSTRYDWYLLQKTKYNGNTIVIDEYKKTNNIDLRKWEFIPNGYFNEIFKLIDGIEKQEIIHSESAYEKRRKWINDKKNDIFKYNIIYSIYKDQTLKLTYSSRKDNGHFGISKVIFMPNLGLNYIIDKDGKYGLSQWVVGIKGSIDELDDIAKIFSNNKFKNILKSIKYGMYYNKHILRLFKKDFWKEFI